VVGVRIGEQEVQLVRAQLARDGLALLVDLTLELAVALCELLQLDDVARAALETVPRCDQLAVFRRLTRQLAGAARVVPRARPGQLGV
jgi:hypothetical protein